MHRKHIGKTSFGAFFWAPVLFKLYQNTSGSSTALSNRLCSDQSLANRTFNKAKMVTCFVKGCSKQSRLNKNISYHRKKKEKVHRKKKEKMQEKKKIQVMFGQSYPFVLIFLWEDPFVGSQEQVESPL